MKNRTINKIVVNEFKNILSEKLRTDNYFENVYKNYIIEWISFELYNFKCKQCTYR